MSGTLGSITICLTPTQQCVMQWPKFGTTWQDMVFLSLLTHGFSSSSWPVCRHLPQVPGQYYLRPERLRLLVEQVCLETGHQNKLILFLQLIYTIWPFFSVAWYPPIRRLYDSIDDGNNELHGLNPYDMVGIRPASVHFFSTWVDFYF